MRLSDSYFEELRVPVQRTHVEVHTENEHRAAVLFLPPGTSAEDILDDDAPFFPAEESGAIRLYARQAVVSLVVDATPDPEVSLGAERKARWLAIHLRSGKVIRGALMAFSASVRTLDLVNDAARCVSVHADGKVHHVVKAHIARIEELR